MSQRVSILQPGVTRSVASVRATRHHAAPRQERRSSRAAALFLAELPVGAGPAQRGTPRASMALAAGSTPHAGRAGGALRKEIAMTRRRRVQGFTLIELMIVVAILGILASIAIPGYQRMQLRASSAEGRSNLAGIRTAEESYFVEYNAYAAAAPTPAAVPGIGKTDFPLGGGFALLGWTPDGEVHFQYAVTLPAGSADAYTAEARSDLDGEGTLNLWGYVKTNSVGAGAAGTFGCPATGVWDPAAGAATLQETVGPCDPVSGLSVF